MRWLQKIPAAVVVVLAIVVVAGLASRCVGERTATSPIVDATSGPGRVSVKVAGAARIDYRGSARVQIVSSGGPNVPVNLRLLSVALVQPQDFGTLKFTAGFNLYNYEGNSRATIPSLAPSPAAGLRSTAFLNLVTPTERRFERPVAPCSVSLRSAGRKGELDCPAIADETGATVSMRMEWDLS